MTESEQSPAEDQPKWRPLERTDRRVVGVLVEKAKTTPDNYPLTLNSLVNGANQKSNRFPQMQLDEEHVYDALERLRQLGAIAEVQGDGRAAKFRHLLYQWLGVDKFGLAVMAELLLRGAQTLGELRGRAARMEPIASISDLRPILDSLSNKGLIVYLTSPGRGCIVTHALYQEQELAKLRAEHGIANFDAINNAPPPSARPTPAAISSPTLVDSKNSDLQSLREEVSQLRTLVENMRSELDEFCSK